MMTWEAIQRIGAGGTGQDQGIDKDPNAHGPSTYQWMLAWILIIALLAFANQTTVGHTIIYYALVLILVLLLVTQYKFIASALVPIGQKAPASD